MLTGPLVSCSQSPPPPPAQRLRVEVLAILPHDRIMYTEGLEIHDGLLYEGSGLDGQSRLRATAFGDTAASDAPQREVSLPTPLFGEGITVAGTRLWQLTWRNGIAIERDPATLAQRRQVRFQGEGWGLCHDGRRLVMSDGTDRLTFRDPATFAPVGEVRVRLGDEPVRKINELECAGGVVWANVYQTYRILRIDPVTGTVTGVANASGLPGPPLPSAPGDVLNGIAAIPGTDEFLITGKHWPSLFRVRFVAGPQ
ncbi:MAG TPA: glutaminyl-peptide cyclotransferase [Pseudonocardiaceae bacterium]|nr:glutaminyl-peptide cyclotransferase [Pseudonocardiaceae bacterium]